jgi:ATPase family AAA domain-containing protein 3A/B
MLGQPSLIRESSIARFPGSEIISQAKNKVLNYSTAAAASGSLKNGLGNIVLHPSLQRRIEQLARATANTKAHQAPFRNMMFYGPPGTGKTMVAREIARKSVLHCVMVFYCWCSFLCALLDLLCILFH